MPSVLDRAGGLSTVGKRGHRATVLTVPYRHGCESTVKRARPALAEHGLLSSREHGGGG
jgi:hypothetical protein